MTTVYKSKIGLGILLPLFSIVGGTLWIMAHLQIWVVTILLGLLLLFISHMFSTTFYTIEGDSLKIKCGFLYNQTVSIASIKKIESSHSLQSAPALSLDRLEIRYGKWDSVLVSPRDQRAFAQHLEELNPTIELNLKP